ncbi:hypothetical protein PM082_009653 [Marasmius tenuissimus]|nr:hypothetical protein PM082_009653 [Marasmius tenuissimus]
MLIDDSAEVDEEDDEGGKLSDDEEDRDSSVERDQDTQEDERIIVGPRQLFGEEYLRPIQRTGGENFRAVLDRHEAIARARQAHSTNSEISERKTRMSPTCAYTDSESIELLDSDTWPIFRFICQSGQESATVLELMARSIRDKECARLIRSVFWNGRPGSVYMEIQSFSHQLNEILKSISGLSRSRNGNLEPTMLTTEDIIPTLTTTSLNWQKCIPGQWVNITAGPYKGDVGLVWDRHVNLREDGEALRGRHKSKRHPRAIVLVVPRLVIGTFNDPGAKPSFRKRSRSVASRPPREQLRWWNDLNNSPGYVADEWMWACDERRCSIQEECAHFLYIYGKHVLDYDLARTVELVSDLRPLWSYELTPDDPLFLCDHPFVQENLHKLPPPTSWHLEIGDLVYVLRRVPRTPDILNREGTVSVIADLRHPQGTITKFNGHRCVVTCDLVAEGEEIAMVDGKKIHI